VPRCVVVHVQRQCINWTGLHHKVVAKLIIGGRVDANRTQGMIDDRWF